mgnify:FL=1
MKVQDHRLFPAAMTIAGSDSGGGAGIQADLRTFTFFRVFGCSAITALTSQNPLCVAGIEPVRASAVELQIRTVRKELEISAIKTGMLFSRPIIMAVARALTGFRGELVVDPVMISTSGKRLMQDSAVAAIRKHILPLATWITPNLPEAEAISGMKIRNAEDCKRAAEYCAGCWNCSVIIKGGHSDDPENAADLVYHQGEFRQFRSKRFPVRKNSDHGTGCTFSAALTALLAKGVPWDLAILRAKALISASLAESVKLSDSGLYAMFPPETPLEKYEKMISCGKA